MEIIRNFDQLIDHLRARGDRRTVAVVWGVDESTQTALAKALESGFINAIFVGPQSEVQKNKDLMRFADNISFIHAENPDQAAALAVALVVDKKADILMKGMLNTDNLLKAVLHKEIGMLPPGRVMTHIAAAHIPGYDHILLFTDSACIPYPNLEQRSAMVGYCANVARALGVPQPRIALIHCSEKVDTKHFPFTADYLTIKQRALDGEYGGAIVDGPLDAKTACDKQAMFKKHLESPIDGQANALVMPDIEAANVFYKTLTLFCHATMASVLQGPLAPVVLPSRGDNNLTKFYSIALAAI